MPYQTLLKGFPEGRCKTDVPPKKTSLYFAIYFLKYSENSFLLYLLNRSNTSTLIWIESTTYGVGKRKARFTKSRIWHSGYLSYYFSSKFNYSSNEWTFSAISLYSG